MNKSSVIEVKAVSKKFAGLLALEGVDLNLNQGEVLSILGPNGAGKTTLINAMLGRISVSSGHISVLGDAPGSIDVKRQIGAMLQISNLPEQLTVKEHIELFQSYYPAPLDYKKVVELAGLEEIENRRSKKLSGGQKQRLLFALSICGDPSVLFLDEPTVGLDINARKSLWRAINLLREQGKSIILTTHYLEEADQLSDRIVMINRGRVIHQGTPDEIKSQTQFKKIICSTELSSTALLNLPKVSQVEQFGRLFHINSSDPVSTLRVLFEKCRNVSNLSVTGAALEDAFVELNRSHQENQSSQEVA